MFADEFHCVLYMVQTGSALPDPFVRYVITTGQCVPSVILYTERQLRELKAFCFKGPSGGVFLFDMTNDFSHGCMVGVIHQRSNEHPIFIGPLFLHGHSDAIQASIDILNENLF